MLPERLISPISFESPNRVVEPYNWVEHIPFAFWLMESTKPRVFVELGTYSGNSYLAFCQAVKKLSLSTKCYAVDTWEGDIHVGKYSNSVYRDLNEYNTLRYDSFSHLIRSTFNEAVTTFADHSIDLLHIDGAHSYDDVLNDFQTWLPKCSDRAIVIFHDTNVRREGFGVYKLWDELSSKYPHFDFLHGNGLGVLAVGAEISEPLRILTSPFKDENLKKEIRGVYASLGKNIHDLAVYSNEQSKVNGGFAWKFISSFNRTRQVSFHIVKTLFPGKNSFQAKEIKESEKENPNHWSSTFLGRLGFLIKDSRFYRYYYLPHFHANNIFAIIPTSIKAKITSLVKTVTRPLKAFYTAHAPWYILWKRRQKRIQAGRCALKTAYQDIPIFINTFNRLACLQLLVNWLEKAGHRRIFIIDNKSDYVPLIDYYGLLEQKGHTVIRLGKNTGHLALWKMNLLARYNISTEFIYTDSDVVPCSSCPLNAIEHLQNILNQNPTIRKAGLGLRIDNLPECYRHHLTAATWEEQFWKRPAANGLMFAMVDTTFALYRPFSKREARTDNLRTTYPFLADHLGWHMNSSAPTEEDIHYAKTAKAGVTNWNGPSISKYLAKNVQNTTPDNKVSLLHLGGGSDVFPGWINLDISSKDFHISCADDKGLPRVMAGMPSSSVDGIYDKSVFADMENPDVLLRCVHRIAKSGARYVVGIPAHSRNKDFFELAFNRELSLSKESLDELSRGLLDSTQWKVERLKVVLDPSANYCDRKALTFEKHPVLRENIKEVIVYLIAVKEGQKSLIKDIPGIKAEYLYTALDSDIDFSSARR